MKSSCSDTSRRRRVSGWRTRPTNSSFSPSSRTRGIRRVLTGETPCRHPAIHRLSTRTAGETFQGWRFHRSSLLPAVRDSPRDMYKLMALRMFRLNGMPSCQLFALDWRNCEQIESIVFEADSRLSDIGASVFRRVPGLRSICSSRGAEEILDRCFVDCHRLTNVTFEFLSALVTIGHCAFCSVKSTVSICSPPSGLELGACCLSGCMGLCAVSFESNARLWRIGLSASAACFSLACICILRSIMSLGHDRSCRSCRLSDVIVFCAVTVLCESIWSLILDWDAFKRGHSTIACHCRPSRFPDPSSRP
jgi:hypothetical protein